MEMNFDCLDQKIESLVGAIAQSYEIQGFRYHAGDLDRTHASDASYDDSTWPVLEDTTIRRGQGIVWLRLKYTVPQTVHGVDIAGTQLRVAGKKGGFSVPTEFYIDGKCVLKETAWMDFKCPEAIITQCAVPGTVHTIAIRMDMLEKCFWSNQVEMVVIPTKLEMEAFEISSISEELRYIQPLEQAQALLEQAFAAVEEASALQDVEEVLRAVRAVRASLVSVADEAKKRTVHLIGHAHIDMNWFWSMDETRQIIARDFDTMTKLLEEYPEFRFSQSQCAVYKIAQEDCPEVFERVKKYEKDGRWDCTASSWVEGDLNMADGESLNRHMLYSKKYLEENGMKEPHIMWCPDTFGHGANVPQLLGQAGISYYYHMRCPDGIGQSTAEAVPFMKEAHHAPLYWWKGADGSRVLTTSLIYNAEVWPQSILRVSAAMRDRYSVNRAMYVYGTGDHGGGPTKRDIEKIRLLNSYPTTPRLVFSTTEEFYHAVETEDLSHLPEVEGELNFIYDGCYTTHADIKRDNRRCENMLDSTERLCVLASLQGFSYPGKRLEELWRKALFNQFHDIFDGTGIPDTYDCSHELAEQVLTELQEISSEAMEFLSLGLETDSAKGVPFAVFNPAPFDREECISLGGVSMDGPVRVVDAQGQEVPSQLCTDGVCVQAEMRASGICVFYVQEQASGSGPQSFSLTEEKEYYYVESERYQVEIKKASGQITTLYDKMDKHYVVRRMDLGWRMGQGVLNTLQVHYEVPGEMSGWLIHDVARIDRLISGADSRIVEDGPVRKVLEFVHHFGASQITQQIRIGKQAARIDFYTRVSWGEYGDAKRLAPMLRVVHTPDIDNQDAVYETLCGTVTRPLKDQEYPALKWAAADGSSYGFALLNDCKHGYKVCGNTMELCLIRSGWTPDPKSDVGEHEFTYSILPYRGSYRDAGVVQQAYFLNRPILSRRLTEAGRGNGNCFLAETDAEGAVISSIKKAESSDAVIVRVFDALGMGDGGNLILGFPADAVETCSTLEETIERISHEKYSIPLNLKPFEQKSFKIYPVYEK